MLAETLAKALGGRRSGNTWLARCPAHDDQEPSLAIRDGDDGHLLVHCHAGCAQRNVVDVLRRLGLWDEPASTHGTRPTAPSASPDTDRPRRIAAAIRIWNASREARGTVVETYLQSRGLAVPGADALRCHPGLNHPDGGVWPAMVARVVDIDDEPIGIHRTFLATDGSAKAPVTSAKMMLGPTRGGAVRLAPVAATLLVGEGVETVLSVMQSTGTAGWAALSTSGMKTLVIPGAVKEVVILADADAPGEAAARAAATRWASEGRKVRIARPTGGCKDFNDMLRARIGRAA